MNKKKLLSIFLFVITLVLLITTFYLNSLLQGNQKDSVTQIKKTKASAQTYHRYLALNITLPTNSNRSSQSSLTNPSPTEILLSATPRLTPQPTQQLRQANSSSSKSSSVEPSPRVPLSITPVPSGLSRVTPTTSFSQSTISKSSSSISSGLLAYKNPTTTLGMSASSTRSSSSINSSMKPIISPSISKRLPETGAVQYSSILFIVAVTTIFIAFLY